MFLEEGIFPVRFLHNPSLMARELGFLWLIPDIWKLAVLARHRIPSRGSSCCSGTICAVLGVFPLLAFPLPVLPRCSQRQPGQPGLSFSRIYLNADCSTFYPGGSKQPLTFCYSGLDFQCVSPVCWHCMLVATFAEAELGAVCFPCSWRLSSLVGLLCVEFSEEQQPRCSGPLSSPKAWPVGPAPHCCILGKCQCQRGAWWEASCPGLNKHFWFQ